MRKLLIIAPFPPAIAAKHGGSVATAELLLQLAKSNRISLIYFYAPGDIHPEPEIIDACEQIVQINREQAPAHHYKVRHWLYRAYILCNLIIGKPEWVVDWSSKKFERAARKLTQDWNPDIIYYAYHIMGQYAQKMDDFPQPKLLIDYDPIERQSNQKSGANSNWSRFKNKVESYAWEKYLEAISKYINKTIVFTPEDYSIVVKRVGSESTVQIPIGLTNRTPEPVISDTLDTEDSEELIILFFGNFIHPPNTDAAFRLKHSIFPSIISQYPQASLYLVGDSPPADLVNIQAKNVYTPGFVQNLENFIDKATVIVAPIRLGGGMRLKVMKAMYAGKPIVASKIATHGLDVKHENELLIAHSDEEFISAILELFEKKELRTQLGQNAAKWANQNLGWEHINQAYNDLHQQVLG